MDKELVDAMTLQEALDYAVYKLVEQGEPCMDNDDALCSYSNAEGHHCGVGWLLDEENKKLMNSAMSVRELARKYPEELPQLILDNLDILSIFQKFHDDIDIDLRLRHLILIQEYGIDITTEPYWYKWLMMGDKP